MKALVRHADWVTYFQWSRISGIHYSSITPRGKWLADNGYVEVKIDWGFNAQGVWKLLMHFRAMV